MVTVERKAAAVVTDIGGAVGADRRTIRSTAKMRNALDATVGGYSLQRARSDLSHQHGPVGQGDRSLWKLETGCDDPHLGGWRAHRGHRTLLTYLRIGDVGSECLDLDDTPVLARRAPGDGSPPITSHATRDRLENLPKEGRCQGALSERQGEAPGEPDQPSGGLEQPRPETGERPVLDGDRHREPPQ